MSKLWEPLFWAVLIGAMIVPTLWLIVTVPPGAQTQVADGLCYRVEARRVVGLTMGYLYWQVLCP